MRTLVTGGDGFVGQHLIELLGARGDEVMGTSLGETPGASPLGGDAQSAAEWRQIDVREPAGLRELVADYRPDRIFHLAGCASTAETNADVVGALRVNAEGTLHVVQAAALVPQGATVIVAGSADAYGRGVEGRMDERTPLRPESLYGATKAAQDVMSRGAGQALGVDVRVARLFPLIGPGQREGFVLPSFCRRALTIRDGQGPLRLRVGNLDTVRDFSDVRDGVRALAALADIDAPGHRTYNICSGSGTAVRRLLEWVLEAAEIEPEVVRDPGLTREGEPESLVGDPARLHAATGWRVERDLHVAVRDTFDWMASSSPT